MSNPLSYIANGAPSSLKIDKTSLQQQLIKRNEVIAAQKAKLNENSQTTSTKNDPTKPQHKLVSISYTIT